MKKSYVKPDLKGLGLLRVVTQHSCAQTADHVFGSIQFTDR